MFKSLNSRHQQIFLELLRSNRESVKLRQADLAHRLGRGQATVSKVESGERRLDVIELRAWLRALEVDFVAFAVELDRRLQAHPMSDGRFRGARRTDPAPLSQGTGPPRRRT
jgi:transcriptional regulator with XRE-family HTH domain